MPLEDWFVDRRVMRIPRFANP